MFAQKFVNSERLLAVLREHIIFDVKWVEVRTMSKVFEQGYYIINVWSFLLFLEYSYFGPNFAFLGTALGHFSQWFFLNFSSLANHGDIFTQPPSPPTIKKLPTALHTPGWLLTTETVNVSRWNKTKNSACSLNAVNTVAFAPLESLNEDHDILHSRWF